MIIQLWGVRGSIPSPLRNQEYRSKITEILRYARRSRAKPNTGNRQLHQ